MRLPPGYGHFSYSYVAERIYQLCTLLYIICYAHTYVSLEYVLHQVSGSKPHAVRVKFCAMVHMYIHIPGSYYELQYICTAYIMSRRFMSHVYFVAQYLQVCQVEEALS